MSEEKVRSQGLPLDLLSDSSVAYRAEDGALLLGDARRLREIPDASVDLVITDPPFNVGISYGVGISDHLTERQYEAFTGRWLSEALRVLKPGGQLYAIMPKHLARIWWPLMPPDTRELAWVKSFINHLHIGASSLLNGWEPIVSIVKGDKPRTFHRLMRFYGDLDWLVGPNATAESRHMVVFGRHPTPRPLWLMEKLILRSSDCGDVVLDPMVGSGTTVLAAKRLGRRFIGYDLNPEYLELASKRLAGTSLDRARLDANTNGSLALSEALGWVFGNKQRFLPIAPSAKGAWGRFGKGYVALLPRVLSKQLAHWGYSEDAIREQWRADGLLMHDPGKYTGVARFGDRPRRMVKIRL